MIVPEGYKQTEIGIIPDEWEIVSILNVAELLSGLTYSPENVSEHGVLVLRSCNIKYGKLAFENNVYVNCNIIEKKYVKENDLLICVRNGSRNLIGKCALVDKDYYATFGAFMVVLRSTIGEYLYQVFTSQIIQDQIQKNCSATINQITNADFRRFFIPLPCSVIEQQAIAEVLTDTDNLISSLQRLIDKKKAVKQGAMEELLTGKRRLPGFNGEWVERKLGDISLIKTGNKNVDNASLYGKYPFFVRSHIVYKIDTYSFDGEAILIPGEGGIGDIFHYINGKFDYHQRVYKISNFTDDISGKYIYYYLKSFFKKYALSNTAKATVDSLRLPTFLEFKIKLPRKIQEQEAIARVLSDMDSEINELEKKLSKYEKIKQGMMQQLLTGRIRLLD